MKTVSGKVTTAAPISLSKAAKVLSNFVAADTAAPQAVSAYLRRATSAFDDLVHLHKALKSSRKTEKRAEKDGETKMHRNKRKKGEESSMKKKKKGPIESEQ